MIDHEHDLAIAKQAEALNISRGSVYYLNVTTGLVSQWERGEKHPRGASLKLLTLVAKKGLQAVA
jgi:DNA-binding transcriptional regulator YiaG